jgi:toxin YoeB
VSKKQSNKQGVKSDVTLSWSNESWDDYLFWQGSDIGIFNKINTLIEECKRTPFQGTGKPEPLKGDLSGFWSRRINQEHRLVYMFEDDVLYIVQCRYHY